MLKFIALALMSTLSLPVFADYTCVRGGGNIYNLPSTTDRLHVKEVSQNILEISLSERQTKNIVLQGRFLFDKSDIEKRRSWYKTSDKKMTAQISLNKNDEIINIYLSGHGQGFDKRSTFLFETRGCMKN